MAIRVGRFKARGIAGSEQYGESGVNNTLTITLDVYVPDFGHAVGIYFYLSPAATVFSLERLRLMGWKGKSRSDLTDLSGIDANEIEIEVTQEVYNGKSRFKIEVSNGGRASPGTVLSKEAFAKRFEEVLKSLPEDDIPF